MVKVYTENSKDCDVNYNIIKTVVYGLLFCVCLCIIFIIILEFKLDTRLCSISKNLSNI